MELCTLKMYNIVAKMTDPVKSSPFKMTKQERDMLDPNYKKPKRKVSPCSRVKSKTEIRA